MNIPAEQLAETSMVDVAYEILKESGEPMHYMELINQVFEAKGFSQAQMDKCISHIYTDLNIDGRFVSVKRGIWGLCSWYPVEVSTDSAVAANVQDEYHDDELVDMIEDDVTPDILAVDDEDILADVDDFDKKEAVLDDEDIEVEVAGEDEQEEEEEDF